MRAKMKKAAASAGRGYADGDMDDVSDAPEFTSERMAAKPFTEAFPELAAIPLGDSRPAETVDVRRRGRPDEA